MMLTKQTNKQTTSKMVEHIEAVGAASGAAGGVVAAAVCKAPPPPTLRIPFNVDILADGATFSAEMDVTSAAGLLMKRGHHLQEEFGVRMSFQKRCHPSNDCTLVISAPERHRVEKAAQGVMKILEDPVSWKQGLQNTKLHIFVDDSNVFYGGVNQCAEGECVNMRSLLRSIQKGRWTEELTVVGSGTGGESRWRAYDDAGYTKHVLPKGKDGREIGVDDTLMSLIMRETDKQFTDLDKRRLVVVTGDGNDNMGRVSFPQVVESAIRKGWSVELWSWDKGRSSKWRSKVARNENDSDSGDELSFEEQFSEEQFSVMSLNNHRHSIIRKQTLEEQNERQQGKMTANEVVNADGCKIVAMKATMQAIREEINCGEYERAGELSGLKVQLDEAELQMAAIEGGRKIVAMKATMQAIREEINCGEYERAGELRGLKVQLDEAELQMATTGNNSPVPVSPPPGFPEVTPEATAHGKTGSHTTSRGPNGSNGFNLARTGSVGTVPDSVGTASPTAPPGLARGRSLSEMVSAGDTSGTAPKTGGKWVSKRRALGAAAGTEGLVPPPATPSWRDYKSAQPGVRGSPRGTSRSGSGSGSTPRGRTSSLEQLAASIEATEVDAPKSSLFQAYCTPGAVAGSKSSTRYAVCKDYAACGFCSYGARCHFQHPGKPGIGLGGATICHSWAATGECEHKCSCNFAHPEVCQYGSGCVPQSYGCKCEFFHPNASAARAVEGAQHSPSARSQQQKQNFKPPDRNFSSFDVLAGRSKRPFRGTRSIAGGSFGGSSRLPPKDVSMTQEDVTNLADHVSLSLSFDPLGASRSKNGFDFRSEQEPLQDLDDMFDDM
jgi:hypothetical protein